MKHPTRVLIADDHEILRDGLRAMLSARRDIEVVGEAENGEEAVRQTAERRPDLVTMDLTMPGISGMDAIRMLKHGRPETKVLVLSVHKAGEYVLASLEAGADGYALKDAGQAELLHAVDVVLAGRVYLTPEVARTVLSGYLDDARPARLDAAWAHLSETERALLTLLAEGKTETQAARTLALGRPALAQQRRDLMEKLGLRSRPALAAFAIAQGLVHS